MDLHGGCVISILDFLQPHHVSAMSTVSKKWNNASRSNIIWRKFIDYNVKFVNGFLSSIWEETPRIIRNDFINFPFIRKFRYKRCDREGQEYLAHELYPNVAEEFADTYTYKRMSLIRNKGFEEFVKIVDSLYRINVGNLRQLTGNDVMYVRRLF